jgi:hypothetical protein
MSHPLAPLGDRTMRDAATVRTALPNGKVKSARGTMPEPTADPSMLLHALRPAEYSNATATRPATMMPTVTRPLETLTIAESTPKSPGRPPRCVQQAARKPGSETSRPDRRLSNWRARSSAPCAGRRATSAVPTIAGESFSEWLPRHERELNAQFIDRVVVRPVGHGTRAPVAQGAEVYIIGAEEPWTELAAPLRT